MSRTTWQGEFVGPAWGSVVETGGAGPYRLWSPGFVRGGQPNGETWLACFEPTNLGYCGHPRSPEVAERSYAVSRTLTANDYGF